jgi:hypothetical protein
MNPTSCLFGSRFVYQAVILSVSRILSSFSMLWAILYFCLDYGILYPCCDPDFAVRGLDCGLVRALIPRKIVDSPAFLEHGLVERLRFVPIQPVRRISRRIRGVPRRLFFAAQQRIATTLSPNYYKKNPAFHNEKESRRTWPR